MNLCDKVEAVIIRTYDEDVAPPQYIIKSLDTLKEAADKCNREPRIASKFYETVLAFKDTIAGSESPNDWIVNNKVVIILKNVRVPMYEFVQSTPEDTERLETLRGEVATAFVRCLMACMGDVKGLEKTEREALRKSLTFNGAVSMNADDMLDGAIEKISKFVPTKAGKNVGDIVKPLMKGVSGKRPDIGSLIGQAPDLFRQIADSVDIKAVTEMFETSGINVQELASQVENSQTDKK